VSISSIPPANVSQGAIWFNREIGRTFIYYDDGDSKQWIETVPAGTTDTNLITSYTNPIYASLNLAWSSTNTAYNATNVAYNASNTALQNTSGVSFNGNIRFPTGNVSLTGTLGVGTTTPTGRFQVVGANGEISRFTATGASGGYHVSYFDNSTPWYIGSALSTIAGNINDLYIGSGFGTTNNLIFGAAGTERMRISSAGHVLPGATNTYDLGSSTARWRNIYTNDLNLSNGIGDYTMVEGEEDLFLYNNKTGKVFKFMLTEVDPKIAPPKKSTNS
jgi:hypothetical protein